MTFSENAKYRAALRAQGIDPDAAATAEPTTQGIQGKYVKVKPGDTVSGLMGSSSPQAVGAFLAGNNKSNSNLRIGELVFVPNDVSAFGERSQLGQSALNADNRRVALSGEAGLMLAHTDGTFLLAPNSSAKLSGGHSFAEVVGSSWAKEPLIDSTYKYNPFTAIAETREYKIVTSVIGMGAAGLGIVGGAAMTTTGGTAAASGPFVVNQLAGGALASFGVLTITKSVGDFTLNANKFWHAVTDTPTSTPDSALQYVYQKLELPEQYEGIAVATDLAWGLSAGRIIDKARVATGHTLNQGTAALLQPAVAHSTLTNGYSSLGHTTWSTYLKMDPVGTFLDTPSKYIEQIGTPFYDYIVHDKTK